MEKYIQLLFLSLLIFLTIVPDGYGQNIKINEVMSSNSTTIKDIDEEFSDWIELYNGASSSINLEGYYLSDSRNNLTKWRIPSATVEANGFLLIWASKKDFVKNGEIHTNFSISSSGEEIFLSDANGLLIDEIPALEIPRDFSYGRIEDGLEEIVIFSKSTPGFSNTEGNISSLLNPPIIDLESGWYNGTINVVLENPNSNGSIIYTLDGSEPIHENISDPKAYNFNYFFRNENKPNYLTERLNRTFQLENNLVFDEKSSQDNYISNVITTYFNQFGINWKKPTKKINKAHILKARVYYNGEYSPTITKTYFVEGLSSINHLLPVISITGDNYDFLSYEEGIFVPGRRFFENGGTETSYVNKGNYQQSGELFERPINLEFFEDKKSVFNQNLGVRIHGGGARRAPNKGIRVYARRDYDNSNTINYPIFPNNKNKLGEEINGYRRLLLRNGGDLMDYLTDDVIHQVMKEMHIGTQNSRPAVKYFNGEYWGIANIRDRIDNNYLASYYGVDPDQVIMINAPWGQSGSRFVEYGEPRDIDEYRALYNLVTKEDITSDEVYENVSSKVDLLSYIDYVIAFVYFNNVDWYGYKHYRFWKSKNISSNPFEDGKFRLIVWDFDASLRFGAGFDTFVNWIDPEGKGNQFATNDPEKTLFLRSLLKNDSFKNLFVNRFYDLINTSFNPERIHSIAELHFSKIQPELENHFDRWGYYPSSRENINSNGSSLNQLKSYATARPNLQRGFLRSGLKLGSDIKLLLDVSDVEMGEVELNTLKLDENLHRPGNKIFPFEGIYSSSTPITLKATPLSGFKFDYWIINNQTLYQNNLEVLLDQNTNVKAVFSKLLQEDKSTLHYWFFNNEIENDTPLKIVPVTYSLEDKKFNLEFFPAVLPYPFENTLGIMDRVNDPTVINFKSEIIGGLGYDFQDMRGIRIRNPLLVDNRTGYLILDSPLGGYKNPSIAMAASRTNNGPEKILISYRTSFDSDWTIEGLTKYEFKLSNDYKLIFVPFEGVENLENNDEFQIRIDFDGNTTSNSGNVRLNNISIEAEVSSLDIITNINPEKPISKIKVFPTLIENKVNIEFNDDSFTKVKYIQIIDSKGLFVKDIATISERKVEIDMGNTATGLYIINIVYLNSLESFKVLKKY